MGCVQMVWKWAGIASQACLPMASEHEPSSTITFIAKRGNGPRKAQYNQLRIFARPIIGRQHYLFFQLEFPRDGKSENTASSMTSRARKKLNSMS